MTAAAGREPGATHGRGPLRPPAQFPCAQCGALQAYAPGTRELTCPYCGHVTAIAEADATAIRELPLHEALETLERAPRVTTGALVQCRNCAAEFRFDENVHAGACPFCGSPVVAGTGEERNIKPTSLLPFAIDEQAARAAYQRWLRKLWLAPSGVARHAREAATMTGVYLPCWTYDAMTHTRYTGERGDAYYVTVPYTATVKGRRVRRTRRERRIRWTPKRGAVSRFFDDVLVGASESLPRRITDRLAPWDLDALVPYDERYLSGFRSEVYQVGLDEGYGRAKQVMEATIRADVAHDIGGDAQRIHELETQYSAQTFKHVLLPVWSAAFRYRDRVYRFVVNGRTGKVAGERPYSPWKVATAVVAALVVILLVLLATEGRACPGIC